MEAILLETAIISQHSRLIVEFARPLHQVILPMPIETQFPIKVEAPLAFLLPINFVSLIALPLGVLVNREDRVCQVY